MLDFPCYYPGCNRTFKRQANLTQHYNAQHRELSPDSEPDPAFDFHTMYHPQLNGKSSLLYFLFHLFIPMELALPCDRRGGFISVHSRPPPPVAPDATEDNPWHPFMGRVSFEWAHHYFVELRAPQKKIGKGLDIWLATKLAAGDHTPLPWSSSADMFTTIDSIQEGNAPFETISFKYNGELPPHPPRWMTQTYELCTRDARIVVHNQLSTADFKDQFNPRPYRQFNHKGDRIWSNLMSADWVWNEAVMCHTRILLLTLFIDYLYRIPLPQKITPMVQCWYQLWPEATRQLSLLLPVIRNIIPFTYLQGISLILRVVDTPTLCFLWRSFPF
jgi:hypothetical protein